MKLSHLPHYLSALIVLACTLVAGCASSPEQSSPAEEVAAGPATQPTMEDVERIPSQPLSAEELELLLDAEFSGYRLDAQRATRLYVEAAERTRDLGVVTRAFEIATAFGNDEQALQMAMLWREIEPGDIPDRYAAQLFARVGETEAAWELAYPLDDESLTLRIISAETLALGDPDRTIWLDQQLSNIESPDFNLWVARAILNNSLNNLEPAAEMAQNAYELDPGDVVATELYASVLARLGDDETLEELLRSWLLTYWTGEESQIAVARMVSQLPVDTAVSVLEAAVERKEKTQELQLILAQAYMNLSREMAAEAILTRLLSQPAYMDVAHLNLAQLAERRNQFELALQHYAAVRPSQWFSQANQRAGEILLSATSTTDLNAYFEIQRTEYPQAREQLYMVQASLLNDLGAGEELFELTSRALQLYPDYSELLYLRSLASDRLGRFDLVEQDLRRMLEINPQDSNALNSLGYMLTERTDRYVEAEELIDQALRLDPENAAIIDSKGWVLYKLEQYDEALLWLQDALSRFYNEEIVVHLAHTLLKLGRNEDAYNLIQEALRTSPNNPLLREAEDTLDFGITPS